MARVAHLEPVELVEHLRGMRLEEPRRAHLGDCPRCARTLERVRALLDGVAEGAASSADEERLVARSVRPAHRERLAARAALSREGAALAEELVASPDASREESVRRLRDHPARGYALLYAAQGAAPLALADPRGALGLALLIRAEAPLASTDPVAEPIVTAEALLLESQALLAQGIVSPAVERAGEARAAFRRGGPDPFAEALCDYFEASARSYAAEFGTAERLLKRAAKVFAQFGQPHWTGRALLALGTVLAQRGNNVRALEYLGEGLRHVDPVEDASAIASALLNTGSVLSHLARFEDAKASYAKALKISRERGLALVTEHVRLGLAEAEFLSGRYAAALLEYVKLTASARRRDDREQVRFTLLYTAECHARLGHEGPAAAALATLRGELREHPFQSVALEDLFACLDRGDADAGLIAGVREHLENPGREYRARRA